MIPFLALPAASTHTKTEAGAAEQSPFTINTKVAKKMKPHSKSVAKKVSSSSKHALAYSIKAPTKIKASHQKVLDAIAGCLLRVPGSTRAPRAEVVAMSKITGKSTFANALTELKKMRLILVVSNGTELELTDEGSELADTPEDMPTDNASHHEAIKEQFELKGEELLVFDLMKDGNTHSREEIFMASGCKAKNSTFANLLTKLKKASILQPTGGNNFKMPATMFPFAE